MVKMKRKVILPTPEEDAAIRAAIAEDPDTFEFDTPGGSVRPNPSKKPSPNSTKRGTASMPINRTSDLQ